MFDGKSNLSRIYISVVGIYRVNQEDKSYKDHFCAFKVLTDEVDHMLSLTTNLNETRAQHQHIYVMTYLASFYPNTDSVRSQIIAGTEVLSLIEAYFRVIRTTKVIETETSDAPADRSAMGATGGGFRGGRGSRWNIGRNSGQGNGDRDRERPHTCFNCGQP